MPEEIQTARLRLRPVQKGDARRLAEFLGDYEVVKTLSGAPHPYGLGEAAIWVNRASDIDERCHVNFIVDDGTGLIGNVNLRNLDDPMTTEIGFWVGRPYWGRGLMTEAAGAVIDWFFINHGHDELLSGCFVGNPASLRIQKKLGFSVVGRSKRFCMAQDADLDHIDTILVRKNFSGPLK